MVGSSRPGQPLAGYVVALACLVTMGVYAFMKWSSMPTVIVTREAGGRHGESVASRALSVMAMPSVLILCTALFALAPLWTRMVNATPLGSGLSSMGQSRILSLVLAMLAVLLLCLHVGIVDMFTGRGPTMPQAASFGLAAMIVGLAIAFAIQGSHRGVELGAALAAAGVVTALAKSLPTVAMALGSLALLLLVGYNSMKLGWESMERLRRRHESGDR
ncbi:hypothetical protein [Luteococcus sp.]|uniref:hypothetical protein n=1 Tax=Luteococcus sp. TaxID=1969402 RepID=UPI00373614F8